MVLTAWLLVTVVRHGGEAVHDLPRWAVVLGAGAAAVAFAGWLVIVRAPGWGGIGVAVVGALVVASIGVVPVVGVLLFVGGMVWMAGRAQDRTDRRGLAGGLLVAIGIPLAALVATDGPIVRCRSGGVSTSSSIFRSGAWSDGSGTATRGGAAEGRIEAGGRSYTYRCAGDRLVEFTRDSRP